MTTQIANTVTIYVPTPLRGFTNEDSSVVVEGDTVAEALESLTSKYGGLEPHLRDESGSLRSFINIYLNDDDIRYLAGEASLLEAGDTLSIIPSIAGG